MYSINTGKTYFFSKLPFSVFSYHFGLEINYYKYKCRAEKQISLHAPGAENYLEQMM
jgi:hypothetical protein